MAGGSTLYFRLHRNDKGTDLRIVTTVYFKTIKFVRFFTFLCSIEYGEILHASSIDQELSQDIFSNFFKASKYSFLFFKIKASHVHVFSPFKITSYSRFCQSQKV
jgi:hypothetical protein